MDTVFDLHLSALQISPKTISALEYLGFRRDTFTNNTRCVASEYHATFKGPQSLPDDRLWHQTTDVLLSDKTFSGCLEEESIDPQYSVIIAGYGSEMPTLLPKIHLSKVPAGDHKACDLHVGINITSSPADAITQLEHLEVASFDKPTPEGIRRVYTVTCETYEDGEQVFRILYKYLSLIPGLQGKMKLEMTTRYLRHPLDAPTLPLTTSQALAEWLYRSRLSLRALSNLPCKVIEGKG